MISNFEFAQNHTYWEQRDLTDEKRDLEEKGENWIQDYILSVNHPHRDVILKGLQTFGEIESVLEIGCNTGPNLKRIHEAYPNLRLAGIDVNSMTIKEAKKQVPTASFYVADVTRDLRLFEDKSFDIILTDAVLIYVGMNEIRNVINEIDRIARSGVMLLEWGHHNTEPGLVIDYHWARNYSNIFLKKGFHCLTYKINEKEWPSSKTWKRNGYLYCAYRQAS